MGRKLPPAPGVDLPVHLETVRDDPITGPDRPILAWRALAIGMLFLAAAFWGLEVRRWVELLPLIAAALGGYLLHGNVLRIRDPRFWNAKPGKGEAAKPPSLTWHNLDTANPSQLTTRPETGETPSSLPDDPGERP